MATQRKHYHYMEWEDWKHGMYRNTTDNDKPTFIYYAKKLLSSQLHLRHAMESVVNKWIVASSQNLTHTNKNRNAWLGQAACCLMYEVPEDLTRLAWRELSDEQHIDANNVAELVISGWEARNA